MALAWTESISEVDWNELEALYRAAPLGKQEREGPEDCLHEQQVPLLQYTRTRSLLLQGERSPMQQTPHTSAMLLFYLGFKVWALASR